MKFKEKIKIKVVFLGVLFFTTLLIAQESKPNILFIAIDDLKPTIGAFGDDFAVTPNLDKLAEKAAVFLNNHTQQAICGPTRASIMTGKRPDYTKVRDLKTKMRDMNPDILTIPQYFKEQGYVTVGTGKIFDPRCVDKFIDKPSWSIPYIREHNLVYSKKYGKPALGHYQNKEIKAKIEVLTIEANSKGENPYKYAIDRYKPPYESSNATDDAYTDGAIANHAIELLTDFSANKSQPFFLAVGFRKPHLPFVAPQKYWDMYNSNDIQLAPFQQKAVNSPDIAYHTSGEMRSYKDDAIEYKINDDRLLELDKVTQRNLIHGYYACVSFIDTQIGKIMNKLAETGLDKNTIIVVWGDHGWHLGDHSLWNKHSNFEQATRSPLLVYSPKINKKITISSPTEFVDVFPTLTDLAGLKTPINLDGKSLKSLVNGTKTSIKKYAVSQYNRGKDVIGYSFRNDSHRYTVWIGNGKNSVDDSITKSDIIAQELYDYISDPLETENLIEKKSVKVIQEEMELYAFQYFKNEITKIHSDKSIKQLLNEGFDVDKVYVGATLNYSQLNTSVSDLFVKEFTYTTPENCAKQVQVHPKPNIWNWNKIDEYVSFAKKNNVTVRLHGPISPQASRWVKEDHRTANELAPIMIDFMTELCKRFNNNSTVKWMDVVNETVSRNGDWFKDKPGVNAWENPWVKMGYDNSNRCTSL